MNRTQSMPDQATAGDIGQWAESNLKQLGFFALRRIREKPSFNEERDLCAVGIALCQSRALLHEAVAKLGREAAV